MAVNPVKFGANSAGTDNESLFLKLYTGSFVSAPRSGLFITGGAGDRFIYRTSPGSGKQHQYLMMGEHPAPEEFEPGGDLMGQVFAVDEGNISTDKYVVCHNWIGKDQMDMSHFQILDKLGKSHRNRLDRLYDHRAMVTAALGARQTTAVTKNGLNIHNGGNRVTRVAASMTAAYPESATGAANLRANLRTLSRSLSEDNIEVSPQTVGLLMPPYLRSVLTYDATGQVFSKDYVNGDNEQQKHEIMVIENMAVLGWPNQSSNNGPLPNENLTTGPSKYQGDFSVHATDGTPVALAFCKNHDDDYGLGMVEFESPTNVVMWVQDRLSWLVMSYRRTGCDVMHPWCLASIEVASS